MEINKQLIKPSLIALIFRTLFKAFIFLFFLSGFLGILIKYDIIASIHDGSARITYTNTYGELAETGLNIIIADTDEKREKGLSGFKELEGNRVMLFQFDEVASHGFWMKDMNFPIDIMWMNEFYEIVYIEENVSQYSFPQIYGSDVQSKYVLETRAGFVEEQKIRVGDVLQVL